MNECQEHWAAMRKAIEDRGMSHLVAKSGEEAFDSMVSGLAGVATKSDWDPLMTTSMNMTEFAMAHVGLAAIGQCPMCLAEAGMKAQSGEDGYAKEMLDSCADSMLGYAREMGLMPKVQ